MKEIFEMMIKDIWGSSLGLTLDKLENLRHGLTQYAFKIRKRKVGLKKYLSKKLKSLLKEDRTNETLAKIINMKIHLNLEIDKEEAYWEQITRAIG